MIPDTSAPWPPPLPSIVCAGGHNHDLRQGPCGKCIALEVLSLWGGDYRPHYIEGLAAGDSPEEAARATWREIATDEPDIDAIGEDDGWRILLPMVSR